MRGQSVQLCDSSKNEEKRFGVVFAGQERKSELSMIEVARAILELMVAIVRCILKSSVNETQNYLGTSNNDIRETAFVLQS